MPVISVLFFAGNILAAKLPTICEVVNAPGFRSSLDVSYSISFCGFPPRACVRIKYHIPRYFIEVTSRPKETAFKSLPGAKIQINNITNIAPSGVDDDQGSYSFDAHTIRIPLASYILKGLPCYQPLIDLFCFSSMSEHLGQNWKTGSADSLQPKFLLWGLSPNACVAKGTMTSVTGNFSIGIPGNDVGMCSVPTGFIPKYIPSNYPVCTGWGIHFPRYGTVTSSDRLTGSLMIASRIKSISAETLQSFKTTHNEKWQMIRPTPTTTFREGQNVGVLSGLGVNELGRLRGISSSYLYAVWQPMECSTDIPAIALMKVYISGLIASCKGFK